ncbi:hypothetical protein Hanom_Chr13g01231141 [Helianthus anomalus]
MCPKRLYGSYELTCISVRYQPYLQFVKLQKSYFIYVTYCKLCPLSLIITENVLDVCKLLQVMSFNPNSVNFYG